MNFFLHLSPRMQKQEVSQALILLDWYPVQVENIKNAVKCLDGAFQNARIGDVKNKSIIFQILRNRIPVHVNQELIRSNRAHRIIYTFPAWAASATPRADNSASIHPQNLLIENCLNIITKIMKTSNT